MDATQLGMRLDWSLLCGLTMHWFEGCVVQQRGSSAEWLKLCYAQTAQYNATMWTLSRVHRVVPNHCCYAGGAALS